MLLTRTELFTPVDVKRRIYKPASRSQDKDALVAPRVAPDGDSQLLRIAFDTSGGPEVVIDNDGMLVMANQSARLLFNLRSEDVGRAFHDLEVSYRPIELRAPVQLAQSERKPVLYREVVLPGLGGDRIFEVAVVPLVNVDGGSIGTAIRFSDVTAHVQLQTQLQDSKHQLETAYEELQSTVEELETTNEELHSTNEELETTNEELQATNEELETMNEELESMNEELETVNGELQRRSVQLDHANRSTQAILSSIPTGLVVLDEQLRVRAWNRGAQDLWGLRGDEVEGEAFVGLDIGLPVHDLKASLRKCLADPAARADIVLDCRDRVGHDIRCRVSMSALFSDGSGPQGVTVLMERVSE